MSARLPEADPDHAELWWTTHLYVIGPSGTVDIEGAAAMARSLAADGQTDRARALSMVTSGALVQDGRFAFALDLANRFRETTGLRPESIRERVLLDAFALITGSSRTDPHLDHDWTTGLSTAELMDPLGFHLPITSLHVWVGDPTSARAVIDRQAAAIEGGAYVGAAPFVTCNQATLARYEDDFVGAKSHYVRSAETSEATGFGSMAPYAAARHAHLLADAAESEAARVVLASEFGDASADLPPSHAYATGVVVAMIELGDGRPEVALDRLVEARGIANAVGIRHPRFIDWAATGAEIIASLEGGQDPRLATLRAEIDDALAVRDVIVERSRPRIRALLATPEDAEEAWRLAVDDTAAGPSPYEAARVLLGQGQWLRRQRRRGDALAPLTAAWTAFDELALPEWMTLTERELRACGRRLAEDRANGGVVTTLTPRELDVAREVATGATNAEIAARLFVSRRTVEFHIGSIFRKLDVTDRNAVADRLAPRRDR